MSSTTTDSYNNTPLYQFIISAITIMHNNNYAMMIYAFSKKFILTLNASALTPSIF